jgi:hypothetical protein
VVVGYFLVLVHYRCIHRAVTVHDVTNLMCNDERKASRLVERMSEHDDGAMPGDPGQALERR